MKETLNDNMRQGPTSTGGSVVVVAGLVGAVVLLCIVMWWLFMQSVSGQTTLSEKQARCEAAGGVLNEHNECLEINKTQCESMGGAWESCGSACRHNPNPNIACTMECVQFCTL